MQVDCDVIRHEARSLTWFYRNEGNGGEAFGERIERLIITFFGCKYHMDHEGAEIFWNRWR